MGQRRAFAFLGLFVMTGCAAAPADGTDQSAEAVTHAPTRHHLFVVRTKGFIAPISASSEGRLGGDPIANEALHLFAGLTNRQFSENPPDGARTSAQYRLWAQVALDVTCVGPHATMKLSFEDSDAGYEGPLKARFDPLVVRSTPDGKFYLQARGAPALAAEPVFQAIALRTHSTIWYTVRGHVACDQAADATLALGDVQTTKFPSFRLWATKHSGGGHHPVEQRLIDRAQGDFDELWRLDAPPAPPATL